MIKRILDVAVASTALALSAPVMAAVAATVRVRLGSPVLFRQRRPGRNGAPFEVMKFRTMTDARGPDGALLSDSQRLTPLGRFLRWSSLDELPQLFNVVRGDMSLVGPRPLLERYVPALTPRERRRMDVAPGITGWAQINGRNTARWDERLALDVWYVDNQSLWLDLKILWRTIPTVLAHRGVVTSPTEAMLDLDVERGLRAVRTEPSDVVA